MAEDRVERTVHIAATTERVWDETNSTLVEFRVSAEGAMTRLTVCESGFASLTIPAGREDAASYESHSRGWTEVLRNLAGYIEQGAS